MLLIVDDHPLFLERAQEALDVGRGVFFAGDAEHAKSLIATVGAAFSLALIDLELPDQDGFTLIREIHDCYPDLPLIAISGVLQWHVLESAMLLGAVDALQKPITPEWRVAMAKARAG